MDVNFLLLRSRGRDDALARIQSDPLFDGLAMLDSLATRCIYAAGEYINIPKPKFLVVHCNDDESILRAQEIKKATACKIICLGADIYSLERYVTLSEIVDIFLVPTELHQEILKPAVWVDVFVLPESIDTISMPANGITLPVQENEFVCWFGYPESFQKSLVCILDIALEKSHFPKKNLTLITTPGVQLTNDLPHLEFSEDSFYEKTSRYCYSLLSHFAYDCHVNTYIKSPNKLITSLVRGMIPLVSNTRNYRKLVDEYNLQPFLYSNGPDLVNLLKNLDGARDRHKVQMDAIATDLKSRFSPLKIAERFLTLLA